MSIEITNCPLCQKDKFELVYLAKDRHYGIAGFYRIVRCTNCSLMFLNPMISDEALSALYPSDYYAYQFESKRLFWKEVVKALVGYRIRTRDPQFRVPGRVLDLGCGTGRFLSEMRAWGWDVYGVEISSAAAELGRSKGKLNIFAGTLQQAAFPPEYFHYVRSNHSFEHISCPGDTLDEIHRILRPDGKLLIGVPNVSGLNVRIFRQYWWYLGAPVHPFTYSVQTLSHLLSKHRFSVERVIFNSDYAGILGSAQIWLNRNNGRRSTDGPLITNPVLKIWCQWLAKLVDLFQLGDAIEIVATKREARA